MRKHSVPMHPVNYAVWYAYASGENLDLRNAIDRYMLQHLHLDDAVTEALYRRHVIGSSADPALLQRMSERMSSARWARRPNPPPAPATRPPPTAYRCHASRTVWPARRRRAWKRFATTRQMAASRPRSASSATAARRSASCATNSSGAPGEPDRHADRPAQPPRLEQRLPPR